MRGAVRIASGFLIAFAALVASHFPLLALPYYWDELGQFIPAALDIYHRLAWVPYSTVPNAHPPALMAYLALVWKTFGYSIAGTRVAMLSVAALGLVVTWRLGLTLLGLQKPALLGTAFLFCCPLFFSQSEMAQLDMPAMVVTTLGLLLFLERRYWWCAVVCCLAVMVKETAIVAPACFGFLLILRRDWRRASLFVLPLAPVAIWFLLLHHITGHWFGSPAFTEYNLFYPLHPVRLGLALTRRFYYLFLGSGNIIGTACLVRLWCQGRRPDERWRVVCMFATAQVLLICVLGGAVLERYLLPVLPVLYLAFACSIWQLPRRLRFFAPVALAGCLLMACVVNPPYPFPMENNLAWATFVTLEKRTAEFCSAEMPDQTIATSFPMAGALRRPEMGYVGHPIHVDELSDFRPDNLLTKVRGRADALIQYSVMWDPVGLMRHPRWVRLLERYYSYVPQAPPEDVPVLTGMQRVFESCVDRQCFYVFRYPDSPAHLSAPSGRQKYGRAVIE